MSSVEWRSGESARRLQKSSTYVYGISGKTGLSDEVRSLVMLGITAASSKPAEFRVHAKRRLANGCTREQVQDVLLLVASIAAIPAAIETNRIARKFSTAA